MDKSTHKRCSRCREVKPKGDFHGPFKNGRLSTYCKPCDAARVREWQLANPDKVRSSSRARAERNRDRIREQQRRRYAENAEAFRAKNREWAAANRDYYRKWREDNADYMTAHYREKRAKRVAATIGADVDLNALWTGSCGLCGEAMDSTIKWPDPLSPSVDHIQPLSRGGSHTQDNLQWSHLVCNVRKGARLPTPSD